MINFLKRNSTIIILTIVVIFGAYLRLHDFSDLARFNADQARDAKVVDKMMEGEEFPLLGPKAGGTHFKLGPAFYYLECVSGILFGNTPSGIAFIIGILGVATIPLLFFLLRFYFSASLSLLLTFIFSLSFYAIKYSKFAWNPNAIPFFFILFLISLLNFIEAKNKKFGIWHLMLAISIGIGIQLHTLLLVLMPTLLLFSYLHIFLKEKQFKPFYLLFILVIVIALNSTLFIYDFKNDGKNSKQFFAGMQKKTEKNSSLIDNFLKDGQFFVQGSTYAISSFDPQKNWLKPAKLLASKNYGEISAAFLGTLFFLFGFFQTIVSFRKEKDEKKRIFLGVVLAVIFLSFLILIPIANELNVRFFIILIFLPYIFLGIIMKFLSGILNKKMLYSVILIALFVLAFLNLKTYAKVYDLENYTAKNSAYGGISVGELNDISNFIFRLSKEGSLEGEKFFIAPFEFSQSLDYFNEKLGLSFPSLPKDGPDPDSVVFFISQEKDSPKILKENEASFILLDSQKTGRFVIFAFRHRGYKIGFITDVHGKIKGAKNNNRDINSEAKEALLYFSEHMKNNFHPDFVVQGGDLIEGTDRYGQKSIGDFNALAEYLKKTESPSYHVIGNHETRGFSKNDWLKLTEYQETYYYFDFEDLRVVMIDGNENERIDMKNLDKNNYYLSQDQFRWLEKILSEENKLKKIVFSHYPLLETPGTKMIDLSQSSRLREIFSKNKISAVFSGHTEKLELKEIDGVRYFVVPGIERSKKKGIEWLGSFAEISVGKEIKLKLFYKKEGDVEYKVLEIPSKEFDEIEK